MLPHMHIFAVMWSVGSVHFITVVMAWPPMFGRRVGFSAFRTDDIRLVVSMMVVVLAWPMLSVAVMLARPVTGSTRVLGSSLGGVEQAQQA